MNIKIAVASNVSFYHLTLPIILPSLIESGIDPLDIHVFIGGYPHYKLEVKDDIQYHYLDHNSYEYSPLIEICDKKNLWASSEYWFLIHDTCKVGAMFKELLYNIPENKPEKLALKTRPCMSMGSYRSDYLVSQKDRILSIKNQDYSEESMNKWKEWGVPNEDFIMWLTDPQPITYNNNNDWRVVAYENWYETGTIRRTEYYSSSDLYKNKSNWGQSHKLIRNI